MSSRKQIANVCCSVVRSCVSSSASVTGALTILSRRIHTTVPDSQIPQAKPKVQSTPKPGSDEYFLPDAPSKCTYHTQDASHSPHTHKLRQKKPKILPHVLYQVGSTPMVRMSRLAAQLGLECDFLAKCEFFNAGGSVKDRPCMRMIEDAEEKGILKPGSIIIEPSSGNTGIGLAMAAVVKGYKCVIVMQAKMSSEKVDILRALGAEVIRTPNGQPIASADSHISFAYRLMRETPGAVILDQYKNPSNSLCHYDVTAEEIIDDCGGKVDMFVTAVGTGGTLTGVSRRFRELMPECKIIAVDPEGSVVAQPASLNRNAGQFWETEGIGHDFVPTGCDRKLVDRWYKSTDKESMNMARKVIRYEAIFVGGSAGSAVHCAAQAAKDFKLRKGQKCVVIIPDSVRNYMTRFINDDWMDKRGMLEKDNMQ